MMAYLTRRENFADGSPPPKKPYSAVEFKNSTDTLLQGVYGTGKSSNAFLVDLMQKELDKAVTEGVVTMEEGLEFIKSRKKYYDDYLKEKSKTTDDPIGLPQIEERTELKNGSEEALKKIRKVSITPDELISFETNIKNNYEAGNIPAPIHLSRGNENELINIFQYIHPGDWVYSAWRNHYHALLHGFDRDALTKSILDGNSMSTSSSINKFYSSAIVGGIIPIALGAAMALKLKKSDRKVWCFIGDMTFETGIFHECYKYAKNFDIPLEFVVEDNNLSVHTPTDAAWKTKQDIPSDIVYYKYDNQYPHHGTGAWVNF